MNERWKEWCGGRCPVLALDTVECVLRGGASASGMASSMDWSHTGGGSDIMSYRLVGGSVEKLPEGVTPPSPIAWRCSAGPGHAVFFELKAHADLCATYEGWEVKGLVDIKDALEFAERGCVCRDNLLAQLAHDFPDTGSAISVEVFADWLAKKLGERKDG